jgi:hypothetical protein
MALARSVVGVRGTKPVHTQECTDQTREHPPTTQSVESWSRACVGRIRRWGWLQGLEKEWWSVNLVFYKILIESKLQINMLERPKENIYALLK